MKYIANYISISRIFLALSLLWIEPLSMVFFVIYLFCGISDVVDGYLARKTNTTSQLGEKLDSISDLLVIVILIYVLFPIIYISEQMVIWIISIGIIRVVSMLVVFVKYRTFGIMHTYGNKITGLLLFGYPLAIVFDKTDLIAYFICVIASISAIEELFIHIGSSKLRINQKSIFWNK